MKLETVLVLTLPPGSVQFRSCYISPHRGESDEEMFAMLLSRRFDFFFLFLLSSLIKHLQDKLVSAADVEIR